MRLITRHRPGDPPRPADGHSPHPLADRDISTTTGPTDTDPGGASGRRPPPAQLVARLGAITVTVFLVALGVLLGTAAPAAAADLSAAQPPPASAGGGVVLALAASVEQVLNNIRNWMVALLAALATVCLTYSGVRWLIAGGEPGSVEKAKTALRSAIAGYLMALLAPLLVEILKGIAGA